MSVCDQLTCCFPLSVAIPANQTVMNSDNFSFQNNGIKKCTCWKTMGFMGKQWGFGENNGFLKQCF